MLDGVLGGCLLKRPKSLFYLRDEAEWVGKTLEENLDLLGSVDLAAVLSDA